MTGQSLLSCRGIAKRFDDVVAVERFDLEVRAGELVALLGPSGCGKTTALRLIAGLERPDAGEVWIHGRQVCGGRWVPPERRRVGFVFQDLALFPHLNVRGNVAFGLEDEPKGRVDEMLALARLEGLEHRMPHELSGGEQQRVAIARSLAPRPDLVLLDEPFSNLDRMLRANVRAEVRELLRAAAVTSVFVTHDNEEALSIADEVAVMLNGQIRQVGTPLEIYGSPADDQVAELVGEINVLAGVVRNHRASSPVGEIPAPGLADGTCRVLVRPEAVGIEADQGGDANVLRVEFFGHDQLIRCAIEGSGDEVLVRVNGTGPNLAAGDRVRLHLSGAASALPV